MRNLILFFLLLYSTVSYCQIWIAPVEYPRTHNITQVDPDSIINLNETDAVLIRFNHGSDSVIALEFDAGLETDRKGIKAHIYRRNFYYLVDKEGYKVKLVDYYIFFANRGWEYQSEIENGAYFRRMK